MKQLYQIATLSSQIADLTRFITSHPTANQAVKTDQLRIELEKQREVIRKDYHGDETGGLTF